MRSGDRHEKDDRSRVDDPRAWVLGWANERKIAALTEQMLEQQAHCYRPMSGTPPAERDAAQERPEHCARSRAIAAGPTSIGEAEARADAADAERDRLVAGSSRLEEITRG